MNSALKWTFPPTGGGVAHGFNDGAQEHFRNNAWKNTIREIIQNSLDAVRDETNPVTVEISKILVPSSEVGAADLAGHMNAALERTREQGERNGEKFYAKALEILGQDAIETLAITDSNTTGLVGGRWDALVYNEGTTNKGGIGAAGGNFGLGKNAPYLVSDLKAVCYSTRYLQRGRREEFIARCKLVAHEDPAGKSGELQHIGFATKEPIKAGRRVPPTRGKDIYRDFRLREAGSGIFIVGFDPLITNWKAVAEKSIAENFFAAVHDKKLKIRIGTTWITHETLDSIFEGDRKNPSYHYYRIIRSPDTDAADVEGDLGRLTVKFSIEEEYSPNRIAYVNRRGMLITDAGQRHANPFHTTLGRGWAKYAAVVRAADDRTDEKIREMEPPNHRTLEYERIIDPAKREKMRRELDAAKEQIAKIIGDALKHSIKDQEINVSELAGIMAIDDEANTGKDGQGAGLTTDLQTRQVTPSKPGRITNIEPGGDDDDDAKQTGEEGRPGGDARPGTTPRPDGPNKPATALLERARVLRVNGKMRVAFTPLSHTGNVRFMIRPAGEVNMRERPIPVTEASVLGGRASASIENEGNVVAVSPVGSERIKVDLDIDRSSAPQEYTGYEIVCVPGGGEK